MRGSGTMGRKLGAEDSSGETAHTMKDTGLVIWLQAMVGWSILTVTLMKVSVLKTALMVMVKKIVIAGVYNHMCGAVFKGKWKNDKQEGYGEENWPDNAVYKGEYSEGKKCGKGRFEWSDNSCYEG
jgi:hypothetical protein